MHLFSRSAAPVAVGLLAATACTPDPPSPPNTVGPSAGLTHCFTAAYDSADVAAAMTDCEQRHFGTEWRKQPVAPDPHFGPEYGGNLEPRIIHASIDARFSRVRACYREGVMRNKSLAGEVRVKFAIDTSGQARRVEDAGSKLKDKKVIACILNEFSHLRFPPPEGVGLVPVVYPIVLGAGDLHP